MFGGSNNEWGGLQCEVGAHKPKTQQRSAKDNDDRRKSRAAKEGASEAIRSPGGRSITTFGLLPVGSLDGRSAELIRAYSEPIEPIEPIEGH